MLLLLPRYSRGNPGVYIDMGFDDRYVILVEQGFDLSIRAGRLADSTLGARYLGTNLGVMVASPTYLSEHTAPRVPAVGHLRTNNLSAVLAATRASMWVAMLLGMWPENPWRMRR